jgi:hypothetical protein
MAMQFAAGLDRNYFGEGELAIFPAHRTASQGWEDDNCTTREAKNSGFTRRFKSAVMYMGFRPNRTPRDCRHGCLVLRENRALDEPDSFRPAYFASFALTDHET